MGRPNETAVLDNAIDSVRAANNAACAVSEIFSQLTCLHPTATYSGLVVAGLMAAHLLHLERIEQELTVAGSLIDQGEK